MGFSRKIGDFDPSEFKGDPFDDLEEYESDRNGDKIEKIGEKIGNIVGYATTGIILGIALKMLLGINP